MLVDNKKQKKFAKENTLLSELTFANPAISIWRNLVFHLTIKKAEAFSESITAAIKACHTRIETGAIRLLNSTSVSVSDRVAQKILRYGKSTLFR